MQYDLSIIIPCFNAEDTISNTLDSIKVQNTNFNFEVILVNDCGKNNYSCFINNYSKYFNIKEIKTLENVGPGGARAYGVNNSNSSYITFIDSDDNFYDSCSLQSMYDGITSDNYDLLIGNFLYKRDSIEEIKSKNYVWLHGKMYKRFFLNKHDINFNNSRANEDNGFNRLILLMNPKITYLDKVVYSYNENPTSITRSNNRSYKFNGLEDYCYNMDWAIKEALKRDCDFFTVSALANDILISLYIYYLGLEKEFDVSKIYEWASPIKNNSNIIFDEALDILIEEKKEQLSYEVSFDDYTISFSDFYNNIKDS